MKMSQMQKDIIISNIAKSCLGIETLETRRLDSLDFHDIAIWEIKAALEEALDEGLAFNIKSE